MALMRRGALFAGALFSGTLFYGNLFGPLAPREEVAGPPRNRWRDNPPRDPTEDEEALLFSGLLM